MDYEPTASDKRDALLREFSNVGYGMQDPIDLQTLDGIIRQKSGARYNPDIMNELFKRIRKNPDGTTTLNNFVEVWMEADEAVRRTINNSEMKIADNQAKREETAMQLRMVKEREDYNPNFISGESRLTVEVLDGKGFVTTTGQPFQPCAYIFCENQRFELAPPNLNGQTYVWNDLVQVPIQYAKSDFLLQVASSQSPTYPLMEVSYPLESLSSQVQKSENLKLRYIGGGGSCPASINVNAQWLYSRTKFYTEIIDELDKDLKVDNERKKDSEENRQVLYGITPSTMGLLPKAVNYASVARFKDLHPTISSNEPTLGRATKGNSPYARPMMITSFVLFALGCLACFIKPHFLDLCIGLGVVTAVLLGVPRLTRNLGIILLCFIVLALVIDFVWLWYYLKPWWNGPYIDDDTLQADQIVLLIIVGLNLPSLPIHDEETSRKFSQWKSTGQGQYGAAHTDASGVGVWGR